MNLNLLNYYSNFAIIKLVAWGLGFGVWGLGFGVWGLGPPRVLMSSKPGIVLEEVWKEVLRHAGGRGLKSCCSGPSKKAQHPQKRLGFCWPRCSGNCLVGH